MSKSRDHLVDGYHYSDPGIVARTRVPFLLFTIHAMTYEHRPGVRMVYMREGLIPLYRWRPWKQHVAIAIPALSRLLGRWRMHRLQARAAKVEMLRYRGMTPEQAASAFVNDFVRKEMREAAVRRKIMPPCELSDATLAAYEKKITLEKDKPHA